MQRQSRLYLMFLGFVLLAWFAFTLSSGVKADGENDNPTFTAIDPPGSNGTFTVALDINSGGEIVGRYVSAADGRTHGFLRSRDGTFTTIDFPGSSLTSVTAINRGGDIVGHNLLMGVRHGFLREKNGEFVKVDFPTATATQAIGINPQGDIVGRYCEDFKFCGFGARNAHGFLLRNGEFTTIDVPGALETNAFKINSHGQIMGSYLGSEGRFHLFLLSQGGVHDN